MDDIPTAAWLVAGFVLAHAAWIVSDLPDKDLLAPFAVIQRSGQRKLQAFEAPTQEEAVAAGKEAMRLRTDSADAWAFAREGSFREGKEATDVIVVDFWARGMSAPVTLIQRFERVTKHGRFKLLGEPMLTIAGQVVELPSGIVEAQLRPGINQHSKVSPLWVTWH